MDDAQGAGRGIVFQIPTLPFPPPPPPVLYYSSSYASPTSHHHPSMTSFPILLLTVLGILTTSVLLLTYYVVVIRCCLNWHSSSSGLIAGRSGGAAVASSGSNSSLPVTGTPAEARGLGESTIQALPTFRYRKAIKSAAAAADSAAPTSECAVCLSEFEEEERVRMLPACLHAFHVDCIDAWLQGNANCPLCRAPPITGHCMPPLMDQLQRAPEEAVVIQVATPTEEVTQAQRQRTSAESAGDTTTAQQVSGDTRNNAWRDVEISSKEDEWAAVNKDRDVLPLRRSSSMGSLRGGEEVRLQIQNILQRNAQFHRDDTGSGSSVV